MKAYQIIIVSLSLIIILLFAKIYNDKTSKVANEKPAEVVNEKLAIQLKMPEKKIPNLNAPIIKQRITHKYDDRLLRGEYLMVSNTGKTENCNSLNFLYNKKPILTLKLKDDGNLVFQPTENDYNIMWESNTANQDVVKGVFQEDGNFVLYDSKDRPQWASKTFDGNILQLENWNISIKDVEKRIIWQAINIKN